MLSPRRIRMLLFALCGILSVALLGMLILIITTAMKKAEPVSSSISVPSSSAPIISSSSSISESVSQPREVISLDDLGGEPYVGEAYGRLTISGTEVDCDLYYGDSEAQMSKGAGTYTGAHIPGENGTVLLAGHTGSFFRDFESAEIGADIQIETRYGTYHYEIVDMQPAKATDETAYDLTREEENIILYTCYPFGQLTPTPYRYFIYGEFVSGPEISDGTQAGSTSNAE